MKMDPENLASLVDKVQHWLVCKRWKKVIYGAICVQKRELFVCIMCNCNGWVECNAWNAIWVECNGWNVMGGMQWWNAMGGMLATVTNV